MYEYNKLSDSERRMILELRALREFPLHEPPRSKDSAMFLITAACYQHKNIFLAKENLYWLSFNFLQSCESSHFSPIAWVFLPNHYHLLLEISNMQEFSEFIRKLHSRISTHMNQLEYKVGRRIWYSFSDRRIRSDRHKQATLHYIHHNPIKHGWTQNSEFWPWSSIHEHIELMGKEKLVEESNKYDISQYGSGWDES